MKTRTILSLLVFVMMISAFGQQATIELTFTAENDGQYVPIDSILFENLTQGGDTTLYAPNTIFVLDYITSISNNKVIGKNTFSVSQNYPNPFKGKTAVDLYLQETEHIIITVRDILGRELVKFADELTRGNHSFAFYSGNEEYYLLTVSGKQTSQTIKMINSNSTRTNGVQCKLVYLEIMGYNIGYKSQNAINGFVFNLGDELKYTAYTDVEETEIINSPTGDQNYTFQFDGWTPCPGVSTVTDIDGNIYNTVQIGTQCWMKGNLKTTTYKDGNQIPIVTNDNNWGSLTTGAYVWYDNDISWKDLYGAMYNWYATVNAGGLCPAGWHVPTDDEWTDLTDYIGGIGSPHGNELKSCRQVDSPIGGGCNTNEHPRWSQDNDNWGTDDYGFSGLPGGYRNTNGQFYIMGNYGYWWASTDYSSEYAWCRSLNYSGGNVGVATYTYENGNSVRCIKDGD